MKRLLWLATVSVFVSCAMHEEYTPPSPIELKPRHTKPSVYDQDIAPDKFGDEGLEPIDSEEDKSEDFDPRAEQQIKIQDDIATAERKNRARKLTPAAKRNITIERKTSKANQPTRKVPPPKTETIEKPKPTKAEPEKVSENLDLDDLED